MNKPLLRAIEFCGTQAELAKKLGVTPVFVNQMLHGVKTVPPRLCLPIQEITSGKVTCCELRPDIFGAQSVA